MSDFNNIEKQTFLFEVSWEVCNKVGGIHTVLATKMEQAIKRFGENYILIGPWLAHNANFIEDNNGLLSEIGNALREKNIACRTGYWDVAGRPKAILISFGQRYNIDDLLYRLWSNFGVDSLASNFEYIEPLLFATLSGEVIQIISEHVLPKEMKTIGHFHEWMCGAGLLHLKLFAPHISTVFTTHATVLGRALAHTNRDIYNLPITFNPNKEAHDNGVFSKHSLEYASAREASCFTTVSAITADETYMMLNKYPDKITCNGIDMAGIGDPREFAPAARAKLLDIARRVKNISIADNSLLWITSGRYEFHNKGFDSFIKSLAKLEKKLPDEAPPIVVFFLIASNHRSQQDSLLDHPVQSPVPHANGMGIATHRIDNPYDPLIKLCSELNLIHGTRKVHIIYTDAYLDGSDGVFNMPYEKALSAFDLSVFPSYYEPWGYTPLESIAYGVPTVTTDLAGFGTWVQSLKEDYRDAVYVLDYHNQDQNTVVNNLSDYLGVVAHQEKDKWDAVKQKARAIATLADWKSFYRDYIDAYEQALEFNELYYVKFSVEQEYVTSYHEEMSIFPRFRLFQHECQLPENLKGLRELAYNFWWSWNDHLAYKIFEDIDAKLWRAVGGNPVKFVNAVSISTLKKKANNASYMERYNQIFKLFQNYYQDGQKYPLCEAGLLDEQHPIAYFCLEYGLDESFQIYSGGLGILAGDYLKTMSDLNIPMIAIGLFYRQGYFTQKINMQGEQVVEYLNQNPNQLPMRQMSDASGEPLFINLEILDRTVYLTVWEVKVGKISLYLLDSDVAKNSAEDRLLTAKLYGGNREYRLMQEIILGIGGTRFIQEQLKITPALYHLNEGHSAFLLLERLKEFYNQGLSPQEAFEMVRASSVFTTHTSVPAGNEVFSDDMIIKYLSKPAKLLGLNMEELLARASDHRAPQVFSMTAWSLRCALGLNAVSLLHGDVVRSMWKDIWPGLLEHELPVLGVTNGVHLPTWLGPEIRSLYDHHLGSHWLKLQGDTELWKNIHTIPDDALWEACQKQKERLLEIVRKRIIKEYTLRNENENLITASIEALQQETLVIGLSRRFATYKRSNLIFRNRERLAKLLNHAKRPIVFLIAGKAHPADGLGQKIITDILSSLRDPIFNGHVIFLENYDMKLAKALVQGVDIWLNNPIINTEACGTSGMKVSLNGGLNFSIKDGWWAEAAQVDPPVGFSIESFPTDDVNMRDEMENIYLLNTLEEEIIPAYYAGKLGEPNEHWIKRVKSAISHISYEFNTQRMARDYFEKLYVPLARYSKGLKENDFDRLKTLVNWKKQINSRFNTVKIKTVLVSGIREGKIQSDGIIKVKVLLYSGKMKSNELMVELVIGRSENNKLVGDPMVLKLALADSRESGILTYTGEYKLDDAGFYAYGVRVLPSHPLLYQPSELGMALWG